MSSRGPIELSAAQIAAYDDQRDLGAEGSSRLVRAYREVFYGAASLLDAGGGSGTAVALLRKVARQSRQLMPRHGMRAVKYAEQ